MRVQSFFVVAAVFFLSGLGCGKPSELKTVDVTGTVTYNGQPVDAATVSFVDPKPDGKSATATTDAQGKFKLQTFLGGTKMQSGAVPGDYVATVTKAATGGGSGTGIASTPVGGLTPEEEERVKAMSPEEQKAYAEKRGGPGLSADQMANLGKPGQMTKPPNQAGANAPAVSGLPGKYARPDTSDLKYTVQAGKTNDFNLELTD